MKIILAKDITWLNRGDGKPGCVGHIFGTEVAKIEKQSKPIGQPDGWVLSLMDGVQEVYRSHTAATEAAPRLLLEMAKRIFKVEEEE